MYLYCSLNSFFEKSFKLYEHIMLIESFVSIKAVQVPERWKINIIQQKYGKKLVKIFKRKLLQNNTIYSIIYGYNNVYI